MESELELFGIILVMHLSCYFVSNLKVNNRFLEFIFFVFLPFLCVTHRSIIKYICIFYIPLVIKRKKKTEWRMCCFDSFRAGTIILVTISIFACDFKYFPIRHGKTKFNGLSLMDLGVGCFLFNNGLFISRRSKLGILKSSIYLLILGFIRLFTLRYFNYSVDILEYGRDLNFYFIMSAGYLLYLTINPSFLLIIPYEFLLHYKIREYLQKERITFFDYNKEGFISIIPSYCLFGLADFLGRRILKSKNPIKPAIISAITFGSLYFILKKYLIVSRRECNLLYFIWISFFLCSQIVLIIFTEYFCDLQYEFVSFCARNMLVIFLVSNFLVLIANLKFDLKKMSYFEYLGFNFGYLFLSFLGVYYIQKIFNLKKK